MRLRDRYKRELKIGQKVTVPTGIFCGDGSGFTDAEIIDLHELVMPPKPNMPAIKTVKLRAEVTLNVTADSDNVVGVLVVGEEPEQKSVPEEEKKLVEAAS